MQAEYVGTLGCNLPKGNTAWKRSFTNHHPPSSLCLGPNRERIISGFAGENFRTSTALSATGVYLNDYWQPKPGMGRNSAFVASNGRMWYLCQDHTLRSQLWNEYEKTGVQAGSPLPGASYGKGIDQYHPSVFGLKHADGVAITFDNSYASGANRALMQVFDAEGIEDARFELYKSDVWGAVTKGQDMDLAGRGGQMAMSYRGYVFRNRGTDGKYTGTSYEKIRVNYVKFLSTETGQALNADGSVDTTNRRKIDLNGTFDNVTYSGDVKGLAIDLDGSAIVCVGNDLVRVTRAGVRTKVKTGMPDPWRLCRSGDFFYVFCWSDRRVHKVRATDFVTVASFGRDGGREQGTYVQTDYDIVNDITEDGTGGYWVAEGGLMRRVCNFNSSGQPIPVTIEGVVWPEYYCGGPWVVPITANPADPGEALFGSSLRGRILLEINRRHLTGDFSDNKPFFKVKAVFDGGVRRGPEFWSGGECEHIWIRQNGIDYFVLRTVGLIVVYRLNRTLMKLRVAATVNFSSGVVEVATNEEGTTFSSTTYTQTVGSRIFSGPADGTLTLYAMNNTGPLKRLPVASFNAHGNPVYNLSQMVNAWEWSSLPSGSRLITGTAVAPDPNSVGTYNIPTGWLAVSSNWIVQFHCTQSGLQRSYNDDNLSSTESWGLSVDNRVYQWNRATKAFIRLNGQTSPIVLNAKHYNELNLNDWRLQSQIDAAAEPTKKGQPDPGTYFTFKCMFPRALWDRFFLYNAVFGGGTKDSQPNLQYMYDGADGSVHLPYLNRVKNARIPYDWYYSGGTEKGAGDAHVNPWAQGFLVFESHEAEAVVIRVTSSELPVNTVVALPADGDPTPNQPPNVSMSLDKLTGEVNTVFTISASAVDPDGSVSKVEYWVGSTKIGETTQAPHVRTWTPAAGGTYALKVIAFDNLGLSAQSGVQSVSVTSAEPAPLPPTCSITAPTSGKVGEAITIDGTASDADGTVSKMEFYVDTTEIFEDPAAPFTAQHTFTQAGTYKLSARATDSQNLTGLSNEITITVAPADPVFTPVTTPLVADAGTEGEANVVGGSTPAWIFGSQAIDVSAPDAQQDQTFYQTERSGAHYYKYTGLDPAKSYEMRLHFCDNYFDQAGKRQFNVSINNTPVLTNFDIAANAGGRFKAVVRKFTVTGADTYKVDYADGAFDTPSNSGIEMREVTANQPPTVSLSVTKQVALIGEVIRLTAQVADADGAVAGVALLLNGSALFTSDQAPHEYDWMSAQAGTFSFRARVTDNQGASATSAPLDIVVTAPASGGESPAREKVKVLVDYDFLSPLGKGKLENVTVDGHVRSVGGVTPDPITGDVPLGLNGNYVELSRSDGSLWRGALNGAFPPVLEWTQVATTPDPPTGPVTDDSADTFGFTPSPGIAATDHEYTLNGGSSVAGDVTANPQPVGNIAAADGQVGVRSKAAVGRNASSWLFNTVPFTNANVTPAAPTGGVVDDGADTFTFNLTPGYAATEHESSLKGAPYQQCTSNQVAVGNIAVAPGELLVRVSAATGRNASPTLANGTAFTVLSSETVAFREPFANTTGADADLATIGWNIKYNHPTNGSGLTPPAGSTFLNANAGAGSIVPVNAGYTTQAQNGIVTFYGISRDTAFFYTNKHTISGVLKKVSFYVGNSRTSALARVAVQVGTQWYVSEQTWVNSVSVASSADFAAQAVPAEMTTVTGAVWRTMSFTNLTIGGSLVSLPAGDIVGVGVHMKDSSTSTSSLRFDAFEVVVE